MPVLQVLFVFRTGTLIFSKKFSENIPEDFNEELVSPFISAIMIFAKESFDTKELSNIQISNNLLTIEPGFLGDTEDLDILGIMISTGMDSSLAHAVLSELVEEFTIYMGDLIVSQDLNPYSVKVGQLPDMSGIDKKIEEIVHREHHKDFFNYDLSISIPKKTIDLIHKLFSETHDVAEIYHYKESSLIEQMLLEYIYYDLDPKIKEKFSLKTDFY